jgi:hypothetical protein
MRREVFARMNHCRIMRAGWSGLLGLAAGGALLAAADAEVVYFTGFETAEGYPDASVYPELRGQRGWRGEGSGGNGLLRDFFAGHGQQAYVGFLAPAPKDVMLSLWRPLGADDPDPARPVWTFSVLMQVVDSTNGHYDDFYWSAYNRQGTRLFTVNFDNSRAEIFYALEDSAEFLPTGFGFSNDALYELELVMNFARNNWIARLNGVVIVDSVPITTGDAALNLGDVDAVWSVREPAAPGDNYLLFDEYTVRIETGRTTIPPSLELLGLNADGECELYVHGERGLRYSIEVSNDLRKWAALGTYPMPDGVLSDGRPAPGLLHFVDSTSPGFSRSFYRVREASAAP